MGSIYTDLTGQVFNRLTVLELGYIKNHYKFWKCQCSCENKTIVYVKTTSLKKNILVNILI